MNRSRRRRRRRSVQKDFHIRYGNPATQRNARECDNFIMIRTALVTGGNRGIGLEVCRALASLGLRVVLTARDPKLGREAAAGLGTLFEALDIASEDSLRECAARLKHAGIHIDVLVNNAAIYPQNRLLTAPPDRLHTTIETNFLGAVRACRAFVPAMIEAGYGRVVNVSSGYGAFSEGLSGPALYCLTKAALNAATLVLSHEVSGDVKVNAACPGWVKTRMGGPGAPRSVAQGAGTIVWLATLPANGPNGGFFRDRRQVAW